VTDASIRYHQLLEGLDRSRAAVYEIGTAAGTGNAALRDTLRAFATSRFPFSPTTDERRSRQRVTRHLAIGRSQRRRGKTPRRSLPHTPGPAHWAGGARRRRTPRG